MEHEYEYWAVEVRQNDGRKRTDYFPSKNIADCVARMAESLGCKEIRVYKPSELKET